MNRQRLQKLSLVLSLGTLLFTFLNIAWFSDQGWQLSFAIPVGTEKGALSTISDLFWLATPLSALAAAGMALSSTHPKIRTVGIYLHAIPLALYSLLRLLLAISAELHWSSALSYGLCLFVSLFALFAAHYPELGRISSLFSLIHGLLEGALLLFSLLFQTKFSQFYFGQQIYMGHYAAFFYSFVVLSVFFFFVLHNLSFAALLFSLSPSTPPSSNDTQPPAPPSSHREEEEEAEEEDLSSLSLEDLGFER